jgi:predicted secreted protein
MKKLLLIGFISILLSMVAISPVMAGAGFPAESYSMALSPAHNSHTNYFTAAIIQPVLGRFVGSAEVFTQVKPVTSYSRFTSYIQNTAGNTRIFTETDNGMSIALTRGQVVKVRLNENPTTGYRWEPSVSSGIQISDDTYTPSTPGRMGSGGVRTWTLIISGTGEQHFTADYKRSWESGVADTYSLQFVVT